MLHKTIAAVTTDIERLNFNTAIAQMMEFTNYFTKADVRPREVMEKFVLILVAVRAAHRRRAVAASRARQDRSLTSRGRRPIRRW